MSGDIPGAAVPGSTLDVLNPARAAAGNRKARKVDQYPAFDWLRFLLASIVCSTFGRPLSRPPGRRAGGRRVPGAVGLADRRHLLKTQRSTCPLLLQPVDADLGPLFRLRGAALRACAGEAGPVPRLAEISFLRPTFTHYTFTRFPQALTEMPLGGTATISGASPSRSSSIWSRRCS